MGLIEFLMLLVEYLQGVCGNICDLILDLDELLEWVHLLLHLRLYDCETLGKRYDRVISQILLHIYLLNASPA